jgi:hypothetical protein
MMMLLLSLCLTDNSGRYFLLWNAQEAFLYDARDKNDVMLQSVQ